MTTPAHFGVVIYAANLPALAQFYQQMFGLTVLHQTAELISLAGGGVNLVLHVPPVALLEPHFNRTKMFVAVADLAEARQQAVALGGQALEGEWANPIFRVANILDPEGNHIQLRQFHR
ncbi:VOC family protein [Balneatrix alpica]|uniref:VOC family protein n=1 Tax=Balneatrix alpica TaxID=75684 RepID=UPI00273A0760|nr:VOC family protein [Balneatrix alpica]